MYSLEDSLMFLSLSVPSSTITNSENSERIRQLIAAFNAYDIRLISAQVCEDIKVLSLKNNQLIIESSGKVELIKEKKARLSEPEQRKILEINAIDSFIITSEKSYRQEGGLQKSKRNLVIYEFSRNRVRRIYYLPAS